MLQYQTESLEDVFTEIQPLLRAHADEIYDGHLEPDWERYVEIEKAGALHIRTLRDNDHLVGYCISVIHHHLHKCDQVWAYNDNIYLDPKYREGLVGYNLLKGAIHDIKSGGVSGMLLNMRLQYPFRSLLKRLGFNQSEEVWEVNF